MSGEPWLVNLEQPKSDEPISVEHSPEVIKGCIEHLARELDPEAFEPQNCVPDSYYSNPRLRLMQHRRIISLGKADNLVRTIMMTLDKEYVLFYQPKFRQV